MNTVANRYKLQEELGTGGMNEVYVAYDRLTGQTVALKRVLSTQQILDVDTTQTDNLWLYLAQEFKVLASLRHPHIISVLDYGFDAERIPYFTMEHLTNAQSILNAGHNLDTVGQVDLLIQVLHGLTYVHRHGLIHRDLKPSNIMVQHNQVKIIDFGLAIESEKAYRTAGTITYIAPEQFAGYSASIASDLYAVGLIGYQLFLRKYPFDAEQSLQNLIEDILTKPIDCSDLPLKIRDVIERLLKKDPAKRYANAYEAIQAFSKAIGQSTPPETTSIRESFLQASKFVGRKVEFDTLNQSLHNLLNEQATNYLIGGESGVGKSRLVDELRTYALVLGIEGFSGQAVDGRGLPFQLWRTITRRLLLSVTLDDGQASILKEIVPDIDNLLERQVLSLTELGGKATQQQVMSTLLMLMKQVDIPLLIILEDLQWADESLTVLQYILNAQEQLSHIMIVATYRNDERPALLQDLPTMEVMNLPRLDHTTVQQLSTAMLGEIGQGPEVIDLLTQETEGNTFFIVEVVRSLAEEAGYIHQIGLKTLPENVFTNGMNYLLQRRLAKIPEKYQSLLQIAAVFGRQIDEKILNYFQSTPEVEDFLYVSELATVFAVQDNTWQFTHDKLREAVLSSIPKDNLPNLYQQVAEITESVYPGNPSYYHMLLDYWRKADYLDKEIYYLRFVTHQMVSTLTQFEKARQVLGAGLAKLDSSDERRVALLVNFAASYERQGDYIRAEQFSLEGYKIAQKSNNPQQLASVLHSLGFMVYRQGRYTKAQEYTQKSLAIYEALDYQHGIAVNMDTLGSIAIEQDSPEQAFTYFQKSLHIFEQNNNIYKMTGTLTNLGILAKTQENYKEAIGYFERALILANQTGDKWTYGNVSVELGFVKIKLKHDPQQLFIQAFPPLIDIEAFGTIIEGLVGYAVTVCRNGDCEWAAQLYGLVKFKHNNTIYIQEKLNELETELLSQLTPAELDELSLKGEDLDLTDVLNNIMQAHAS